MDMTNEKASIKIANILLSESEILIFMKQAFIKDRGTNIPYRFNTSTFTITLNETHLSAYENNTINSPTLVYYNNIETVK